MKKLFLLTAIIFFAYDLRGQIVFEHVYDSVVIDYNGNKFGTFAPFRISGNEVKYAHVDSLTITLYNLDHTIFNTIPIPLMVPLTDDDEVDFISRTLFDSDSSNVEYMVYGKNMAGVHGCHVFRDDGTLLFSAQGYSYQPQLLLLGARKTFQNIVNTPQGTKLLLTNSVGKVKVWSLPGTYYPFTGTEDPGEESMQLGLPVPNPVISGMEFSMVIPHDVVNPRLVVHSEKGENVFNFPLHPGQTSYSFDSKQFSAGVYLITIVAENSRSKTRKVLIK